jgi:hypothetical protein
MRGRLAFLVVAALVATLIAGELYISMRENAADEDVRRLNAIPDGEEWAISGSFTDPASTRLVEQGPLSTPNVFLTPDSAMGYRLLPNLRDLPLRARMGGKTQFEAKANTQRFGWRVTPQVRDASADVLFLGDVFGETVNDSETLPARFSAAFGGKALAHNLGVPGYTPEQTLKLLQLNAEKDELEQRHVTKVFYMLGPLREPFQFSSGACSYSSLCVWLRKRVATGGATLSPGHELALRQISDLVKKRYGVGLTVVEWQEENLPGFDVVPASTAIPAIKTTPQDYVVGGNNGHASEPNARALNELGTYLAQRLGR